MSKPKGDTENPVAAYKALLRDMIDRRPSGTRQKIAQALGKHKSFVSQITNPTYDVPVPARHLPTIFEICHFSPEERRTFTEAFQRAHPGRQLRGGQAHAPASQTLTLEIPALKSPERQAELIESIKLYADHAIELAKRWEDGARQETKGKKR